MLVPAFSLTFGFPARADNSESSKRALAEDQFDRAEEAHDKLNSTADSKRSFEQYKQVVNAYRRVYQITPHEEDVPTAILTVGNLYREMGQRFDPRYFQSAVDAYQFLLHDYPTSRYREEALYDVAQVEKDDLRDRSQAQKFYESFLKLHPRSAHAKDAQEALAELASPERAAAPAGTSAAPKESVRPAGETAGENEKSGERTVGGPERRAAASSAAPVPLPSYTDISPAERMEAPVAGKTANLTQISTWVTPDYTRLVIGLDGPVKYQSARIGNPQRIYFDLSATHLNRASLNGPVQVQGDLVKDVRIAQNKEDLVRVVLEVEKVKNYSVFLLRNPYRMVVDVYPEPSLTAKASGPSTPHTTASTANEKLTSNGKPSESARKDGDAAHDLAAREKAADAALASSENSPSKAADSPSVKRETDERKSEKPRASADATDHKSSSPAGPVHTEAPVALPPAMPAKQTAKIMRAAKLSPPPEPEPNLDGQRSLTRVLGLKIGRIVIDAGHGGHDTGTIGPTGLMEKDLCLDVALRLGKLIEKQLPGAEVVYTRSDDTFIPLEERTAIANQAKADLFISIHANSSGDHAARGVETYYLNFSSSPEAMQVAARENATAQGGVHNLQDMIQQIARNEKIEESKELAADIQGSLTKRLQRTNHAIRDRGVRKAPFVVLIGANMPSILAEISFISNPADEQLLKKPENRQHVADGLYRGVETYLQSINSLTLNQAQAKATPGIRPGSLSASGNQR